MKIKYWGLAAVTLTALWIIPFTSQTKPSETFHIVDEINVDGPALFYAVAQDRRKELWSVHCLQPMRGCVARAPGLVVRLDENAQAWLIAAVSPKARISVQSGAYIRETPSLFTTPLSTDTLDRLAAHDGFLTVREHGVVSHHTRTTGLDRVVSYLKWVSSQTAHTLRDARLWPRSGTIHVQDMTPEVRERYDVMRRRAREIERVTESTLYAQNEQSAPSGMTLFSDD